MENRVKVVVDLSKPKGQRESIVPLTDEEIAQLETDAADSAERRLAEEEAAQTLSELKTSARAKLVSGQPLTEAEAATLVI